MKHNVFQKLISVMLVLAMLVGTLAVLSFGTAAEDTDTDTAVVTDDSITMDTVEKFIYADNYYQGDWTTGKLNVNKNQLLKADSTKDMLSWASPAAVGGTSDVTLENGELSFLNATIWGFNTKINPSQMDSDALEIGPAMIGFDIYMGDGEGLTGYVQFKLDGTNGTMLLNLNLQYGHIYYGNTWSDIDTTAAGYKDGKRTAGWYTIDMIFVPVDAEGVVCTTAEQTIAKTLFYVRISKAADNIGEEPYAITPEELSVWKSYELTSMTDYYANEGATTAIGYSSSGAAGSFKMRRAKSSNLTPFVTPALPEVTFEGYEALTQYVEANTTIVLPAEDGVIAWELDGKYYFAGDEFVVEDHTCFVPVHREFYQAVKGHDSSVLWKDGAPKATNWSTVYHSDEGTSPILQWYGTENVTDGSAWGYTYDATEKSVMIYRGSWNQISLYPKKSTISGVALAGANCVASSFDLKYTAGGGLTITAAGKSITVTSAAGEVQIGGVTIATLNEGWNNFQIYYIPVSFDADDPTLPTAYKIFVAVNAPEITSSVTMSKLMSFAHFDWSAGKLPEGDNFSIVFQASTAAIPVGFRNMKSYRLDEKSVNSVIVEGTRDLYVVEKGTEYTLPTVTGGDKWIAIDQATGVTNVKAGAATMIVSNDIVLVPATTDSSKFKGASMSLGGEMAINMKVDSAALSAESPDGLVALVDGTALQGMSDGEKDDKGLYTIAINGILARDMAEELSIYLVTIVGEKYYISENPQAYSTLIYAQRMYAKSETKVQELLKDMLGYGAAAEKNIYGTNVIAEAAVALGITSFDTTLPTNNYDDSLMTDTDIATIAGIADIGATLTNGISLYFEEAKNEDGTPKAAFDTLVVTLLGGTNEISQTYTKDSEGKIVMDDIMPYCINAQYKLTFMNGETVVGTANVTVGEYLTLRMNNYPEEADLITATIIYMVQVKEYADVR